MTERCPHCNQSLQNSLYAMAGGELFKTCPACSQYRGVHQFFPCPEAFGLSDARGNNRVCTGVQSSCASCRGGHEHPSTEWGCERILSNEMHIIRSVRLLPMSSERLPEGGDVDDFVTRILQQRDGVYYFGRVPFRDAAGCLFLFQYRARIVGHALCSGVTEFHSPDANGNRGYYQLIPATISLYLQPFNIEAIACIDRGITQFNQTLQEVKVEALPKLFGLLRSQYGNCAQQIIEEISSAEEQESPRSENTESVFSTMEVVEGHLQETLSSRYERNRHAREMCLQHYCCKNGGTIRCEVCGFDFGETYGEAFRNYIHVHHLTPVAAFDGEHTVNPIKDLIPICPNCHAVAHCNRGRIPYTPDEIRNMLERP